MIKMTGFGLKIYHKIVEKPDETTATRFRGPWEEY